MNIPTTSANLQHQQGIVLIGSRSKKIWTERRTRMQLALVRKAPRDLVKSHGGVGRERLERVTGFRLSSRTKPFWGILGTQQATPGYLLRSIKTSRGVPMAAVHWVNNELPR